MIKMEIDYTNKKEGSNPKWGVVFVILILVFSVLVVGFGAETVEADEQLQSTGISDWYDLDDIRNDMEGDYHLENDPSLSGDGTASDPYEITNLAELQSINDDLDAHYILMNDINASETESWNKLNWTGTWEADKTYTENDYIEHDGYYYYMLQLLILIGLSFVLLITLLGILLIGK